MKTSRNNRRNSRHAGVGQQSNQSKVEDEKLLNTGSNMEMFLNVCDVFEKLLGKVEINCYSEQVHEKLCGIQEAIQQKIEPFKWRQFGSDFGDLTSSRSLASSMQSLCSVTSEATLGIEEDLTFKQFLIKVNCPFCSESEADKINLIRHLNNCRQFILKAFKELNFRPYSVFQILPNNTFKCNVCPSSVQKCVKTNFVHARSSRHIVAYKKLAARKTFTEFFFCASCKVTIPNNFTQLDIHINSQVHASKSLKAIKVDNYLQKNIHCLYMKCKKFKCLICLLQSLFNTPEDILQHFDDTRHLKVLRQKHLSLGMIFCEFCSVVVQSYELLKHFSSNEHMFQEKLQNFDETFELCLYCGVMCKNLKELAEHMEKNCNEINKLRKEDPKLEEINFKKQNMDCMKLDVLMKHKSNNDKKIQEGGTKKRNVIIVMNNTEISTLIGYFNAFGEIIAVEIFKEKNVLIEFKEKRAVDNILKIRDLITLNDSKLEITTDEELKSEEKVQPKMDATQRRVSFQEFNSDHSASESGREDEKEDSRDGDDPVKEFLNLELQSDQFGELLKRVSSHLINSTEKFSSDLQKTILQDCDLNFDDYKWTLVGFAGSGLSFSAESISLYLLSNSVFEHELHSLCRKILDEPKWTDVTYYELEPVPYIKAIHGATKTVFKITKEKSTKVLTDILCYCQKENDVVKPFCLMIRFWLGVHDLKIREFEYVIMSLVVFFLVNEQVVKPFSNIDAPASNKAFVFEELINDNHKPNEDTTKDEDKKTYSVQELFMKFLLFLIKFDFDKNAICASVRHPILRDKIHDKQIKEISTINRKSNCPMFIWDPLLQVNLAQSVTKNNLKSLLDTVNHTIFR